MISYNVKCAIMIISELHSIKDSYDGLTASELKIRCSFAKGLQQTLNLLRKSTFIGYRTYKGKYYLTADLDKVSLYDLVLKIDGGISMAACTDNVWPETKREYRNAKKTDAVLDKAFIQTARNITLYELTS